MTERAQRTAAAVLAALLLVVLSACSGIPRAGQVETGDAIGTDDDIDVIFLAADPTAGATQQEILNGFILAAKSPQDDYAIARRYLTDDAADVWRPNQGTTVDSGPRPATSLNDTTLQISVSEVARVDGNGSYTETGPGAPTALQFGFTQVDGEWRINDLADGIVIEELFFDQVFTAHALYFYDPTFTYLVPDLRWFPTSTAVGTRVVRALLAGPSAWLGDGAVVTAFPDGTITPAVVTAGGQTQVELSGNVLEADAVDLQRMQRQLSASLSDLASASNIAISVDQNIVPIPAAPALAPEPSTRVDSRPLVVRDGAFGYLAGASVAGIQGISAGVESLQPVSAAYSETAGLAAAGAAAGGVYAVRTGEAPVLLDQRPALIAPAVDPFGYVWSVPAGSPTELSAFGPEGTVPAVPTNWDGASSITSFEISRDGTRALAFLSVDGVPKLVVAAVIRNQDGVPQQLGRPVELRTTPGTPVGATWVDQLSVASVTRLASGEARATTQTLGGRSTSLGSPTGAVAIAGGNDLDGLRVLSAEGGLLQQRGSAWQTAAGGIGRLAVQN
ncbi:LpqB family beta-propeller domain-containing protein [Herbiconiux sp. CPCC 203407]|uniref:LpqB family beta-propeller domain-containing protein n=1 Tax=Herbiconiux oxytropis TaxID=2970915 RepID=A0AA41XG95_9MICO|nr:LpqB family beta-propeller domain-containing protein [Herbiconiux oxytropis]MCS5722072.1 LpqB family beta-propeller domain-containing protein [Herbiconiux oxytropis]MCS5725654.1 LpqB family beta-propeller domain-containing protein [Herbiconiux oxytropis]